MIKPETKIQYHIKIVPRHATSERDINYQVKLECLSYRVNSSMFSVIFEAMLQLV